jgi:hypothetical protein
MDSAEEQVRDWAAAAQRQAAAARALVDELARISATARGASGEVTLTVDATGALVDLQLGDGVRTLSPARLAGEIMATVRTARDDVAARVGSVVGATVGTDTPVGAAVLSGLDRQAGARRSDPPPRGQAGA